MFPVFRALVRYWRRHPLQVALTLAGVALGVAVFTGIREANRGALSAFAEGIEAFSGKATHRVFAPGGGGVPEEVFPRLFKAPGVRGASPVLEGWARWGAPDGPGVTVLGMDLISAGGLLGVGTVEPESPGAGESGSPLGDFALFDRFLAEPGAALVSPGVAALHGNRAGKSAVLWIAGRPQSFHILGTFRTPEGRAGAFGNVVLVDPATFQERFDRLGRLDAIDLLLDPEAESVVEGLLPPGLRLETAGKRSERVAVISAAFQTNLEALGLFTVVVAVFLIFNAANFATVQRKPLIATLRCIGATRGSVLAALLAEALLLGLAGGAVGVVAGRFLALVMVEGTRATLFELFLFARPAEVVLKVGPEMWIWGLGLGLSAALLAALLPAWEGSRVSPMGALRGAPEPEAGRRIVRLCAAAGAVALAVAGALALPEHGSLMAALVAATALAIGGALFVPLALTVVGRASAPALGRWLGPAGRMAARNLSRSFGRTGVATASLMIALSLWLAVAVTVGSFRHTFELWMEQAIRGEYYVSLPGGPGMGSMAPEVLDGLRAAPWVRDMDVLRRRKALIGGRTVLVVGIDIEAFARHAHMPMNDPDPGRVYREVAAGGALVSETLAYPLRLEVGGLLTVPTPEGERRIPIAGVVQNYGAPAGIVYLDRRLYRELYGEEPPRSVALWVEPGTGRERIEREIAALPGGAGLRVMDNRALLESALEVFDRTFAITALMRSVAALVAFVAVVSALMALLSERQRILGYLRAIGVPRRTLALSMVVEALLLAGTAAIMSWAVGWLMSVVLIFVVNRRAFGWTLQFHPAEGPYVTLTVVALAAAVLGSLYPIYRIGRLSVAATIREE